VTTVNVHDYVGEIELFERIRNTVAVSGGRGLACLQVVVGDQVGQRIGLNDQSKSRVGVLFENGNDGYNEYPN
jgi:hypothetical protein